MAKLIKSTLRPSKGTHDESLPTSTSSSQQVPIVQPRPSTINKMTRSMTLTSADSSHIINSDLSNESFQTKSSMTTSLFSSLIPSNNNNNNTEQINNSAESVSSPVPPVSVRTGKAAIGTLVLPVPDPSGEPPPVKLRHIQPEKKSRKQKKNLK